MKPKQNIDLRVKQMKQGNKLTSKVTQKTEDRIQDSQLSLALHLLQRSAGNYLLTIFKLQLNGNIRVISFPFRQQ